MTSFDTEPCCLLFIAILLTWVVRHDNITYLGKLYCKKVQYLGNMSKKDASKLQKPTSAELAKLSQSEISQFAAASVGRLSNLFPHWMLLNVENPANIPSSRLIVLWLLKREQSLSMSEIGKAIDLTPRGITRIVDGLEADGLARRIEGEFDKRIKMVELTSKGQRFLKTTLPDVQGKFRKLFSKLEKSESIEMIRLLEKLTDQLKTDIDDHKS